IRYASLNASAISAGEPLASAGSGMPQCAVIGWPGHTGQISPAALSQTVKAKSSGGAPGFANSFHDFERKPDVSEPRLCNSWIVCRFPRALGWVPGVEAWNLPAPSLFRMASAMIERAELPVHKKRT